LARLVVTYGSTRTASPGGGFHPAGLRQFKQRRHWSYGGFVICDYVRFHGEDAVGGYNLVAAATKLNVPEAAGTISQEILNLAPGLVSTDFETGVVSLVSLINMFTVVDLTPEQVWGLLGYNVIVPPYVREALFSRQLLNDDVLRGMQKPALITHGEQDAIGLVDTTARVHMELLPNAQLSLYPNVGHAPFLEDYERFNRELREFALSVAVVVEARQPSAPGRGR
jgi:pimeloyl-ACP methyl ester carboxylesterase